MRQVLTRWYERYFSNEESTYLVVIVLVSVAILAFLGEILTPLFVAIILAYLMQGMVEWLKQCRLPHIAAVSLVFTFFIGLVGVCLFLLLPLVWSQALTLIDDQLPVWLKKAQSSVDNLATD